MAVNIMKILRSLTPGNRPTGVYGQQYVNFGDNQFGVINSSNVAQDLVGVPFFSTARTYSSGQAVSYLGQLYISNTAVTAGAFNPAQWSPVIAQKDSSGGNRFINSGFHYWQRGSGPTTVLANTTVYVADRWVFGTVGGSVSVQLIASSGPALSPWAAQIIGSTSNTNATISQRIESINSTLFCQAPVTIQAKIYNNTGATITPTLVVGHPNTKDVYSGGVTNDVNVTLQPCPNGVWTTVAYTFTLPFASANLGVIAYFQFPGLLNAVTKSVYITDTDIRLTPGYPVGLCANPPAAEVALISRTVLDCYRYYQNVVTYDGYYVNSPSSGVNFQYTFRLFTNMRASPSVSTTIYNASGFANMNPVVTTVTQNTVTVYSTTNAAGTAVFTFNWIASAEL